MQQTIYDICKQVREQRQMLWNTQKMAESARIDWLESVVQNRAHAAEDPDWEKRLKDMITTARKAATNRKLGIILRGRKGALDRIQMPLHDWYFSLSRGELYHLLMLKE